MKEFMDKDFLLNSDVAKSLYHDYASKLPIFDYHCHLPIKDIYENRCFEDISELWIADGKVGDHYKWRLLRLNGVDEKYITGAASGREKFRKFAETLSMAIGNPIYHWSHLELKSFFGINETLSLDNADRIYDQMNSFLKNHPVRDLITMSNVDTICTTDDPIDDLKYHIGLKEDDSFKVRVLPSFRPDKVLNLEKDGYVDYIGKLGEVVGYKINNLADLEKALCERMDYFDSVGCLVSDHSLEDVNYVVGSSEDVDRVFVKKLNGEELSNYEMALYKGYLLVFLGKEYGKRGWVQQYHINAYRNNSSKLLMNIGPDAGGDSINDSNIVTSLSKVIDAQDRCGLLPKTICYSLNPKDLEALATLIFAFSEPGVPGKMQLGSGWWFLDQKDGMIKQLTALSHLGMLSNFVGMLTDSRSFLSYPRHEYFRRILCNYIGNLVENGEYPCDMKTLGKIVENVCFYNALNYFVKKEDK